MLAPWKKDFDKPRQHIKKQRHHFADKSPYSQSYSFSSSQVQFWELVHKDGWALKNWGFWTVVLEKTLESLLDCMEIKSVSPKSNQPWMFIERTDVEAPMLWTSDVKSQLIRKDPDAGKDWGQEKGATEDEMVWWHHRLNAHEFEQAPGVGDGQGSLVCCGSWGCKELATTERVNNNNKKTREKKNSCNIAREGGEKSKLTKHEPQGLQECKWLSRIRKLGDWGWKMTD